MPSSAPCMLEWWLFQENQLREKERQKRRAALEEEEKTAIVQAMKEGKQPHFRKKCKHLLFYIKTKIVKLILEF